MERIEHQGVVSEVGDKSLWVNILQSSGCVSCSVKGACNVSEVEEKRIEITHFSGEFRVGERVMVFYKSGLGFKALFWGYVLPFVVLLTVLSIGSKLMADEALAGLIALGALIPYYGALYLFRKRINDSFQFEVEPIRMNS